LSKDDFFDYYYTFNVLVGFSTKVIYDGFFSDFFEVYYDLKKFEMIPVNSPLSPIKFAPYDLDLGLKFDAFMIADNDLNQGQKRLSDTDVYLILPSLKAVRFLVNASDVLHAFVILSTGVKVDAVVGRLNEVTVYLLRSGIFYGACSELCGSGHFGMPVVVESLNFFHFDGFNEDKI